MKVSDYIVSFLVNEGVRDIFMITGGGAMHLNESFGSHPKIHYYCNHHEQASAIAAEAYARIRGLGVCVVTTGPGGTNTLTGLAGAWLDSIPVLFISGQGKRETIRPNKSLRQLGVQELNIVDIVNPITKYAVLVKRGQDIRYHLEKAIFLAKTGRPGPVWLDVPLDVQSMLIDPVRLRGFVQGKVNNLYDKKLVVKQITQVFSLLAKAKRPVILAGGGIRLAGAYDLFTTLTQQLQVPVLTAMSSHDLIASSDKLFFGRPGAFGGERVGNFMIQNADLLLSIGVRHHLWTIGFNYKHFARGATKIFVDIDKAELEKPTVVPDLSVHADAKFFLEEMLIQKKMVQLPAYKEWFSYGRKIRKKYSPVLSQYKSQKKWVNSYYFVDVLSMILQNDDVITTANGTAFSCTLQAIRIKKNQRLISNIGCAAMGYGLPAAIGASIATGKKKVICIEGDGSIQMNLQELQTVVHHKLPIKLFILNNQGYLAIRITQDSYFNSHYVGADPQSGISFPNMLAIAKAYGIPAVSIQNHSQLAQKLKKVLDARGPYICEIMMDPNQPLIPKVTSVMGKEGKMISKPLEDMYPFLDRKEFFDNMIISPMKEDI